DIGSTQVLRLTRNLKVEWRFGREGSGPKEFRTPMDVGCDSLGRAWVPDPANGRIARIAPDGELDSLFVTKVRHERIAISPAGKLWSIPPDPLALVTSQTDLADSVET